MRSATRTPQHPRVSKATRIATARDIVVGALLVVALSFASCWLLALPTSHVLLAAGLYALLAAVVLRALPPSSAGPGLGAANRVTLARAALVIPVVALALRRGALPDHGYWWILLLSAVAMVLDGVDGRVARRTGTDGAFGARFDMEMDAILLLALSGLVWQSEKVSLWVLLIGALRYLFVLGGVVWSQLKKELPPSVRRQVVCVVQGVSLVVCVAPVTSPSVANPVAAAALLLLSYSFVVDVWWLQRSVTQPSH